MDRNDRKMEHVGEKTAIYHFISPKASGSINFDVDKFRSVRINVLPWCSVVLRSTTTPLRMSIRSTMLMPAAFASSFSVVDFVPRIEPAVTAS